VGVEGRGIGEMPGGRRDGEYSHAEIDRQRPYSVTYPSIRLPGWGGVDVPSANGPTTLGCCPDGAWIWTELRTGVWALQTKSRVMRS